MSISVEFAKQMKKCESSRVSYRALLDISYRWAINLQRLNEAGIYLAPLKQELFCLMLALEEANYGKNHSIWYIARKVWGSHFSNEKRDLHRRETILFGRKIRQGGAKLLFQEWSTNRQQRPWLSY